jgi:hypothetical protein
VVRAEGSSPSGRGFKSRRILDGSKRCYYISNEKGNKGSQMWHTKKIFFLNGNCYFDPKSRG